MSEKSVNIEGFVMTVLGTALVGWIASLVMPDLHDIVFEDEWAMILSSIPNILIGYVFGKYGPDIKDPGGSLPTLPRSVAWGLGFAISTSAAFGVLCSATVLGLCMAKDNKILKE